MTTNIKDKLRAKQLIKDKLAKEKAKSAAYLLGISKDSSGSPLKLLLNKHQIKYAKDFLYVMGEHKFPGSEDIKLESRFSGRLLGNYELNHDRYREKNFVTNMFKWRQIWSGKGYPIGILAPLNSNHILSATTVYLCSDSTLRCRRNEPVFQVGNTFAAGAGVIPEKELGKYKFIIGRFRTGLQDDDHSFMEYDFEALMFAVAENQLLY